MLVTKGQIDERGRSYMEVPRLEESQYGIFASSTETYLTSPFFK